MSESLDYSLHAAERLIDRLSSDLIELKEKAEAFDLIATGKLRIERPDEIEFGTRDATDLNAWRVEVGSILAPEEAAALLPAIQRMKQHVQ